MTAPERIWAMPHRQLCWNEDNTNGVLVLGYYEYVRADLHDATKAQLEECEARLRKAVEALRDIYGDGDAYGCNPQWMVNTAEKVLAEIEKGGV